jgi:hypothetical protein
MYSIGVDLSTFVISCPLSKILGGNGGIQGHLFAQSVPQLYMLTAGLRPDTLFVEQGNITLDLRFSQQ